MSLIAMDRLGLFDEPKNDPEAKSIAAAIALVGALVASATTLVGIVIKFSIGGRNARFAALESARNYSLAAEAEQRNRIQAAISAVDLLGENNADASSGKINGAVLALVSLGELDLAVALVRDLWPAGTVRSDVADLVLRRSLADGSAATAKSASALLYLNAAQIDQDNHHIWPLEPDWRPELPLSARIGLAGAAVQWLDHCLTTYPDRSPSACVAVLYHALADPDPIILGIARSALTPLVDAMPDDYWVGTSNGGVITAKDLRSRVTSERSRDRVTRVSMDAATRIQSALLLNNRFEGTTPSVETPSEPDTEENSDGSDLRT